MQYNYSHDNDGAGYLLAQYEGVRPNSGNVVRHNISENDGRKNSFAGIQIWSAGTGVTNADIYNNSVYMSPAPTGQPTPIYFMNPTVNVRVRNNIFAATGNLPIALIAAGQKGVVFQGNDYWSATAPLRIQWQGTSYASLASWRSATSQEMLNGSPVGMNVDPGFQNPGKGVTVSPAYISAETRLSALSPAAGYKLNSNSALLNAGLNLAQFGLTPAPTDFFGTSIYQDSGYEIGAYEQPGRLGQDVNGDRVIDCSDVMLVKAAYGSVPGSPNWNRFADVVTDGVINVRDLASVSQKLPAGTMCN
jgi:hypothetical protein